MTTLARGISATATILDVSDESLNVTRPFLAHLDSETVRVRGLEYVSGAATRWNVDRGIDSTPATHAGGATVTLGDGGVGGAAEAGTVVSDTDPGAIGAGNIWVREYDDTAVTGDILYDIHIRNDADDGWLRPQLLQIVGGVLRSRITLDGPATGGDIEVRDANGDQLLLMAWGSTGDLDIQNNAADLSWINHLKIIPTGGAKGIYLDSNEDHGVTINADGVVIHSFSAQVRLSSLPTADPVVANALWNDTGTVKVSAGP